MKNVRCYDPQVGEQTAQPDAPQSASPKEIESMVAKERMMLIMQKAQRSHDDAKLMFDLLNANPELDGVFCRLFQIQPLSS